VPRSSFAPSTAIFTFRRTLSRAVKLLISLLRILDLGSLKREIPKQIKNAETKKIGKSSNRTISLSSRTDYPWI
jgi:hypothetical protein